jgi:hypothetical protein
MNDEGLALARLRCDYARLSAEKELADAVLEKVEALCQGDPNSNTLQKLKAIRAVFGIGARGRRTHEIPKRCPVCNDDPAVESDGIGRTWVSCCKCQLQGPVASSMPGDPQGRAEAIRMWNSIDVRR